MFERCFWQLGTNGQERTLTPFPDSSSIHTYLLQTVDLPRRNPTCQCESMGIKMSFLWTRQPRIMNTDLPFNSFEDSYILFLYFSVFVYFLFFFTVIWKYTLWVVDRLLLRSFCLMSFICLFKVSLSSIKRYRFLRSYPENSRSLYLLLSGYLYTSTLKFSGSYLFPRIFESPVHGY